MAERGMCTCGHPKSHHVECSLGALVGGVWGCMSCNPPAGDKHFFTPFDDGSPRSLYETASPEPSPT